MTEEKKITLLPGRTLVQLEGLRDNVDTGDLVLPEGFDKRTYVATVLDTNLTDKDRTYLGVDSLIGARVLVVPEAGTWIDGNRWIFPNLVCLNPAEVATRSEKPKYDTPFLAIAHVAGAIAVSENIPRCKYCGPARPLTGPNNMILVSMVDKNRGQILGCPRCGKDQSGNLIVKKYTKQRLDTYTK